MSNSMTNFVDSKQMFQIARILIKIEEEGLPQDFIEKVFYFASKYEGVRDLLDLWINESDPKERNEIIADLHDEIEEFQNAEVIKPSRYIQFDNLELIASDVLEFKKFLKIEIDRWGGISKLSKVTGIPIPSLSRFLNTPSLPRRTTLEKIAKALHLKESDLLSKWIT